MAQPLKVLILEDVENDAVLMIRELQKHGFQVEHERVESEESFRSALQTAGWDLILADYNLPNFDARAALEIFAESSLDSPLIVLSGTVGEEVAVQTIKLGASDYVLKDQILRLGPAVVRELKEAQLRRERKRLRAELSHSEGRFRLIFDGSPDAILILGSRDEVVEANNAACELFKESRSELIGKAAADLVPNNYRDDARRDFKKLNDRIFDHVEGWILARGDQVVPVEFRMTNLPRLGADSERLLQIRDITGLRQAHLALRETTEQLHQVQKMEAIGNLAGGIAHEFNNLLQVIQGYTSITQARISEDRNLNENLEQISEAVSRAAKLTSELLSFARRRSLELTVVDANKVVADLYAMMRPMLDADIDIQVKEQSGIDMISADARLVQQILLNLCLNARDAMPEGGVLRIETKNVFVDEQHTSTAVCETGNYVVVEISDSGPGIDTNIRDRIFEPFFTTKQVGKGTGLGLSVVYGMIQQHRGFIEVDNQPGSGSSFAVYFPVIGALPQQSGADGATILVAEDDELVRKLVVSLLNEAGYRVLEAKNGQEAIQVFDANIGGVNLAIIDVVMPLVNGVEVYHHMRKRVPDLPIVFATGYRHGPKASILSELDAEIIEKPYRAEALLGMLSSCGCQSMRSVRRLNEPHPVGKGTRT